MKIKKIKRINDSLLRLFLSYGFKIHQKKHEITTDNYKVSQVHIFYLFLIKGYEVFYIELYKQSWDKYTQIRFGFASQPFRLNTKLKHLDKLAKFEYEINFKHFEKFKKRIERFLIVFNKWFYKQQPLE